MKSYYQHLKSTQEFGEIINTPKKPILRSSGVFPVIHNQYYSSSLHFVGYWLIKSNTPETLSIILRNADGKTLLKKTEIIDAAKGYLIDLSSLLLEIGFDTKNDRSKESIKLHIWGLTNFDLVEISKTNSVFTELDVWLGKKEKVKTYIDEDIYKTIPKARKKYLKVVVNYNGPIEAPVKKDDIVGKLKISYKDEIIEEHDLLAYENIKKVNIFSRLIKSFNYLIWGDV